MVVWALFDFALLWDWRKKLTFSNPVTTAEFSRFADILSAALSQHHLLGFKIDSLIPSPPLALLVVMPPKALSTSHSRIWHFFRDCAVWEAHYSVRKTLIPFSNLIMLMPNFRNFINCIENELKKFFLTYC